MKKYFFAIKEVQFGPFSLDEILTKNLDKDTLVWHEGLPDWVRLSEIPELNVKKDASLPPPIRVKGSGTRNKNSIKILYAISFMLVTLIAGGIYIYPKLDNVNLDSAKYWYKRAKRAVVNNNPMRDGNRDKNVEQSKKETQEEMKEVSKEEKKQLRNSEISTQSNSSSFEHQCNWCGKGYNGYGWDTNVLNDKWVVQQSAEKTGIVGSTIFELDYIWARNVYCTRKCATESIRGGN
jgi:hypothetical protein